MRPAREAEVRRCPNFVKEISSYSFNIIYLLIFVRCPTLRDGDGRKTSAPSTGSRHVSETIPRQAGRSGADAYRLCSVTTRPALCHLLAAELFADHAQRGVGRGAADAVDRVLHEIDFPGFHIQLDSRAQVGLAAANRVGARGGYPPIERARPGPDLSAFVQ